MRDNLFRTFFIFLICTPLCIGCDSGGGNDDNSEVADADITLSPTPEPSTTPTTGGCPAINERPAAGTYSGDGGCGISEVGYTVTTTNGQQTVVLEPFGANGATTFTVTTGDSSTASSVRQDLTILGITGYSCAISCSAPSTFSVSCFKEGGTSCEEKF